MARSFFLRLRGLLFRAELSPGEGLYLEPCNSIHMFGMSYAIDAVFMDRSGVVVGLIESISPGKISRAFGNARSCLELPAGTIGATGTEIGDLIELREPGSTGD